MTRWWMRLARYARPHGAGLTALALVMIACVGLDVLKPWPLKIVADCALRGDPLPSGWRWLAGLHGGGAPGPLLAWMASGTLLIFLVAQGLRTVQSYVEAGVGGRLVYDLGADVFEHLQRLSPAFHARRKSGDLIRRVTADSGCARDLILWVFLLAMSSAVSLVSMFAVMWRLNRQLAIVSLLAVPPLWILIRRFSKPMSDLAYEQQRREGEMMALVEETLTALPVVQAFSREEHENRRFMQQSKRTIDAFLRATLSQLKFKVGTASVTAVGTACIMGLGAFRVLDGSLTVGSLLVFLAYLGALYGPMETMAYLAAGFAGAAAGARRVYEVLDCDEAIRDAPGARPLPAAAPGRGIEAALEGVEFGYEAGKPVLRGVSLAVRPGERVALVGPTGSGKTTLVSLIPRFFDPWKGCVLVNGRDVRDCTVSSLRKQVSLVLQDPFLLPATVAENIAYGRPDASRAEIEAAAAAALAAEFIGRLPGGYDAVIGERGATLSGGERQRLSVARALLKNAPLLILDEPTSALDAETEHWLMEGVRRLMENRTTFIIAHRLSTIRSADRIVFLGEGRIFEEGTHDSLLARNGAYAGFCRIQKL